jgi:hypothetical protein
VTTRRTRVAIPERIVTSRGASRPPADRRETVEVLPAALAPLLVLAVAFVVYCLVDLVKAEEVQGLPKWAWAVIILVSIPVGGIVYLLWGRQP